MLLDAIREAAGEEVFILGDLGKKRDLLKRGETILARIGKDSLFGCVLFFGCIGDLFSEWENNSIFRELLRDFFVR